MKKTPPNNNQKLKSGLIGNQLPFFNDGFFSEGRLPKFRDNIKKNNYSKLPINTLKVFQINLGYLCNQTCEHCHVDAGPQRREIMSWETMLECLNVIEKVQPEVVDLTGGAPEMNPKFKQFVLELKKLNIKDIIVRSNLTVFYAHKRFNDLPDFFKKHRLHIISSLPCYTKENTDKQRGEGVFNQSIEALKRLNHLGYASVPDLELDLVYNPGGAFLPGDQKKLELAYKHELKENFNISFNQLFTITNMPISRFLDFLIASERYEEYMTSLVNAFNPATIDELMCTHTISVDWEGYLYDCDFNQMLGLKLQSESNHISDFNIAAINKREIITSQHCYGCAAGSGSSCQGTVL